MRLFLSLDFKANRSTLVQRQDTAEAKQYENNGPRTTLSTVPFTLVSACRTPGLIKWPQLLSDPNTS